MFLKSVDGLKPVDLILRRVEGELCDPLELRSDSHQGVAALLQAARARTVTIANAIGSGLAEAKALMGYLPELCERLLGEPLKIQSVATRWCGDPQSRDEVLERLDSLAIDSAFKRRPMLAAGAGAVLPANLGDRDRETLIRNLMTRGHEYVGHDVLSVSTTPVWDNGTLAPRPMTLRVFLASQDNSYIVMPGGLTRVSSSTDARAIRLQRGDSTKDTWVLSDQPVGGFSLLRSPLSYVEPKRTGKDLPSRAADNLFWLGRYAERCEDRMRVLRSVLRRLTEDAGPIQDVAALQRVIGVLTGAESAAGRREGKPPFDATAPLETQVFTLLFVADTEHGLQETLADLRRTAALVRDRLSLDAWSTLNRLQAEINRRAPHIAQAEGAFFNAGETLELLDDSLRTLAAFNGMEMENMTRSHGWRFLNMGRRLERAEHLAQLLTSLLVRGNPEEDGSLILLLELADSLMTYRSRYLTTPILPPVIDLLLLDETNPRSVGFQMVALSDQVDQLPRDADGEPRSREQRLMLSLLTDLRLAEIADLCEEDEDGHRHRLAGLLDGIVTKLPELSEQITRTYFSLGEARRPVDL